MSTPAQIAANQANAQKSCGPRTDAGKETTRKNAIRHGLCGSITCLDTEDTQEMQNLLGDLNAEHQPQGPTEQILVFKMAEQFWLMKRAAYCLAVHTDYNEGGDDEEQKAEEKQIALYLRYYNSADRGFNRNLNDLRKLQKERRQQDAQPEIGSVSQNAQPSDPPAESPVAEPAPIASPEPVSNPFSPDSSEAGRRVLHLKLA